jgi:membrane associated rhomboid family serine protease
MTSDQPVHPSMPSAAPVCPRHPDRVSYVRCQRCGRPTCPDCQRQAAVGVQCVDCVAEAARVTPSTRTVLGGRVRQGRPVVTLTLIGLCVLSYALQYLVPGWTERWMFVPAFAAREPWTFLTSAFLHSPGQIMHIVFNMIALWMVGPWLEVALGRSRFVTLYLLSAIGGSVGALVLATPTSAWMVGLVGASGAVFGLFGAVLVVFRRLGRDAGGIVGILVINAVLGFVLPGIAWQAHLGGLLTGALLGAAYAYAPQGRQRAVSIGASAAVAGLLLLLSVIALRSVGLV